MPPQAADPRTSSLDNHTPVEGATAVRVQHLTLGNLRGERG